VCQALSVEMRKENVMNLIFLSFFAGSFCAGCTENRRGCYVTVKNESNFSNAYFANSFINAACKAKC